ncbi:UDP-galactose translocator, partial [Hyalella azteca]|uniref:UDP-galactose translocator n=1 Tax=Hyalella azteca TaxID=294128 RepID=A0A8B7MYK3_HYAAZ
MSSNSSCATSARSKKLKVVSLITLTLINTTWALSMRYSRTRKEDLFLGSTAVLMSEACKLILSANLVVFTEGSVTQSLKSMFDCLWKNKCDTLKVSVPALAYLVQNNLLYVAATNLDAATYQ